MRPARLGIGRPRARRGAAVRVLWRGSGQPSPNVTGLASLGLEIGILCDCLYLWLSPIERDFGASFLRVRPRPCPSCSGFSGGRGWHRRGGYRGARADPPTQFGCPETVISGPQGCTACKKSLRKTRCAVGAQVKFLGGRIASAGADLPGGAHGGHPPPWDPGALSGGPDCSFSSLGPRVLYRIRRPARTTMARGSCAWSKCEGPRARQSLMCGQGCITWGHGRGGSVPQRRPPQLGSSLTASQRVKPLVIDWC